MSPISNASKLAEFGSGIGTDGAVLQVDNTNKRIGIGTTNPQSMLQVGTGVSVYGNVGIVSATEVRADTLRGDGSNITGVVGVGTLNVRTETVTTSGVSTFAGVTKVTNTTDSTSTTTGALLVSGGVGIAKSLHVGQNITIGGTLTYEDVTNIDSLGIVTARAGVNVSGGQFLVGSGVTIGNAGVATFSGTSDVHLLDNVRLNVGDGSDIALYFDGTNAELSSTGAVFNLTNDDFRLKTSGSETMLRAQSNDKVELMYNNSTKFQTTNNGSYTTGIHTATASLVAGVNADTGVDLRFRANRSSVAATLGNINLYWNDNIVGQMRGIAGEDTTNKDDGHLVFYTSPSGTLSEKLRIASTGNIGINSSVPVSKVDIVYATGTNSSTNNLVHLKSDPGAAYQDRGLFIKIGRDGNYDNSSAHYDIVGSSGNSGVHIFEVQGDEKFRITKTGQVGINSATPNFDLDIRGGGGSGGVSVGTTVFIYSQSHATTTSNKSELRFGFNHSGNNYAHGYIFLEEQGGNAFDGRMNFGVPYNNGGGGSSTRHVLQLQGSTGNVGIGTTIPVASSSAYNSAALHIHQTSNSSAGSQIHLTNGATGGAAGNGSHISMYTDDDLYISNQESDGQIKFATGGTNALTIDDSQNATFTGSLADSKGDVRRIIYQNKTSGYTLVAADAGKAIHISTGGVTINNSLFSAGDAVTIINNSGSNQTITQGSGVTLYDTGDDGSTGNKTLKGRGMATVWFSSASVGYITGNFD